MGHARALLSFDNEKEMLKAYNEIIKNNLSVRKTEKLTSLSKTKIPIELSRFEKRIQADLAINFKSNVKINKGNKGNGKIVIPFKNDIDFNRIIELLDK